MVRSNFSAGSRKEGTQGTVAFLKKNTSKVVHLKTQIQWILFCGKLENWDWTLRRDTPETLRMQLVQNWIRERKRATWRQYPKRWTSWVKSLRARFWGVNTWGNRTTSRLWQQGSVEFGEKKAQCCAREIWSSDRKETLREGPKTVSRHWPRLGKSANNRGRTSFVRDFDLFVTVRLLDETPAVLLLHILCSSHRYPVEWKIGETPRLATNWKSIARNFVWKSEPRFGRWCFKSGDSKNGSTVLTLTSANTERDLFPEQKRLVTWKQHRGTRSHYFSGYYPCETKTSQETEKNLWNIFRAVTEAKSYFYERLVEVWRVLWRIIMESSDKLLPIDQRQQIAERAVRRVKEGTSAVLL